MATFKVVLPPNQKEITLAMPYGSFTLQNGQEVDNDLFIVHFPQYFQRVAGDDVSFERVAMANTAFTINQPEPQVEEQVDPPETSLDETVDPPLAPKDEKVEPPKLTGETKGDKPKKNLFQRG